MTMTTKIDTSQTWEIGFALAPRAEIKFVIKMPTNWILVCGMSFIIFMYQQQKGEEEEKKISVNSRISDSAEDRTESEWKENYAKIFEGLKPVQIASFRAQLQSAQIQYHSDVFINSIVVKKVASSQNCKILTLYVSMSYFTIKVRLFNEDGVSPTQSNLHPVGKGSFGCVYRYSDILGGDFAIKNISYKSRNLSTIQKQNEATIKQCCLYKLLSCFRIGPKMADYLGYDLIVYDDSIEFAMEICEKVNFTSIKNTDRASILTDLMFMHELGIVHGDIKEDNFMFSPTYNKVVFIDFNCSRVLNEKIGYKTFTSFKGNRAHCYSEMSRLYLTRASDFVDLYYNDAYGLKQMFKQNEPIQQNSYEQSIFFVDESVNKNTANRLCQCYYLHLKLRMLIIEKKYEQCILFIQKYESNLTITQQMRIDNKKIINQITTLSTKSQVQPHSQIVSTNKIITETISMLIEIPLTRKLIQIKELIFQKFQIPSAHLENIIENIYAKKSSLLLCNQEKIQKYQSRFNFQQKSKIFPSSTVKMLNLVSLFICNEPIEKTEIIVAQFLKQIESENTGIADAINKMLKLIYYHRVSDKHLIKAFNILLNRSKIQFEGELSIEDKFKEIMKLRIRLEDSEENTEDWESKQPEIVNYQIYTLLDKLNNYIIFHQNSANKDEGHINLCEKLWKILYNLQFWNEQFFCILKMKERNSVLLFHECISRKINELRLEFQEFPEELQVYFYAIFHYLLCFHIKAKNLNKMSAIYSQAFEDLNQFASVYDFNERELKNVFFTHRLIYSYKNAGIKYVRTYAEEILSWSQRSLHLYCNLFYQQIFAKCYQACIFRYPIDYHEILELLSIEQADNLHIIASILKNLYFSLLLPIRNSIYEAIEKKIFRKKYYFIGDIWLFYSAYLESYCQDYPMKTLQKLSELTMFVENNFHPPYPAYYWIITFSITYKTHYFQYYQQHHEHVLQQYPSITDINTEMLYSVLSEISYKITRKSKAPPVLPAMEKFISVFIEQTSRESLFTHAYLFFCFPYLLQKNDEKILVKFLIAIISNSSAFASFSHRYYYYYCRTCLGNFFLYSAEKMLPAFILELYSFIQRNQVISKDAYDQICGLIYQVFQIELQKQILNGKQNQLEVRSKFFMFIHKNILKSAFFIQRQIKVDFYHFIIKFLKNPKCRKFNKFAANFNSRLKYFKLRQFRQNQYKSYCHYSESVREKLLRGNRKNGLKILQKLENYHRNKMQYIIFNHDLCKQSLPNRLELSKDVNEHFFFDFSPFYLAPVPKSNTNSWIIGIGNSAVSIYFYRVYIIEAKRLQDVRIFTRSRFIEYWAANGYLLFQCKSVIKKKTVRRVGDEPICMQVDQEQGRIVWMNKQLEILAEYFDNRILNVENSFDVEIRHQNPYCQIEFSERKSA